MTERRPTFTRQDSSMVKDSDRTSDFPPLPTLDHDLHSKQAAPAPNVWATFIGSDRTILQKEPLVWNQGAGPLVHSLAVRTRSIFTKRFLICLIAGQLLSLAITSTSVLTTELVSNNWAMPTTQTFFLYFFLNLFYTPYTLYRYGPSAWAKMVLTDGWKYFILAAVDVEGNFLVVKAYQYSDLLSCTLIDAWATPCCMIFAFFLVKARYHWTQILGVLVAIGGLGLLVASDYITDKNYQAMSKVKGDIFMLIGATCYGLSNSLEERFVRERPLYEVVGMLGFFGTIINGVQAAGLEHQLYKQMSWSGANVGYLVGYTVSLLFLYTLAPILFRLSSSPFYNLSILTSDFFALCFGLSLFHYKPYFLYFIAYPVVLLGLILYFSVTRPEALNLQVVSRGKQLKKEEAAGKTNVIGDARI